MSARSFTMAVGWTVVLHSLLSGGGNVAAKDSIRPIGIQDLKVTTDTSIDCSSLKTIARDLYRDLKSEEEKAIATWYFVRRTLFHWPHVPTWDSLDLINSYGWGLCGYQSNAFVQIATAGGLKSRLVHAKSHVIAEAWYGDAWHMYDCQVGWFAWRKDKSAVASCAEMKADKTIITDAVKDGRQSKPWFQCSGKHANGVQTVNTHRPRGAARKLDRRLVLNLRRGESIRRIWGNEGKAWHRKGEKRWVYPAHGCTQQRVDANDPVNWPYWKPYAETRQHRGKTRYGKKRYFGNGRMTYAPDLATAAFRDGLAKDGMLNVRSAKADAKDPKLHPVESARPAHIIFTIACPYILVDASLEMEALRTTEKDELAVFAKGSKGEWQEVYRAAGTGALKQEAISLKKAAWAGKGYQVKFALKAGAKAADVGLNRIKITSTFMNNMYALPHFKPGPNTIRVTAANGADLKTNKLSLEYAWMEEGKEKKLTRQIGATPFSETITVAGKALPRMKYVELSVAP